MCLINLQINQHPNYPFILAANRDEFYERPTEQAHLWEDACILAGRDCLAGGTWLGIDASGRIAALTNFRGSNEQQPKESRGQIVSQFLTNTFSATDYIDMLKTTSSTYNGYNLILGSFDKLYYFNNIENRTVQLMDGFYGLSNHFLNTPWPKVMKSKHMLKRYFQEHEILDENKVFQILHHQEIAPDEQLPNTGIGLELERQLSPVFIRTREYGTRCSTFITVNRFNQVCFIERTYEDGVMQNDRAFSFRIGDSFSSIKL